MSKPYKKTFLTNVIFKVNFSILPDFGPKKLKEFQKNIKSEFPIISETTSTRTISLEVTTKKSKPTVLGENKIKQWLLYNKKKTTVVGIAQDNLSIDITNSYKNFEAFLKTIKLVLDSLFKTFPSIVSTRIGLRYIDQIQLPDKNLFNWSGLINEELVNKISFNEDANLVRKISLVEFEFDDYRMTFQYGIPNSLYPNKIIKKEFSLDYDCYTNESYDTEEQIIEVCKKFNEKLSSSFENSIGNKLRKIMQK